MVLNTTNDRALINVVAAYERGDHGSEADREPAYPNRRDDEADATGRDPLRQVDGARVGPWGLSWSNAESSDSPGSVSGADTSAA